MKIKKIIAREIIDSRGNPTIEVVVKTDKPYVFGRACVPSGASTGELEALELRDDDKTRFNGKGVLRAIDNVNLIANLLIKQNLSVFQQREIDRFMIEADGTVNKSKLGANAILGISIAVAKAAAAALNVPLYRYLGGCNAHVLPTPMLNIINGGAHADNDIDFQEFMIVPGGAKSFRHAMQTAAEIYAQLKQILSAAGHTTSVGDEGGFAPSCQSIKEVLDYMSQAVIKAGYKLGTCGEDRVAFAIDGACSELFVKSGKYAGKYDFKKHNRKHKQKMYFDSQAMVDVWTELQQKYPLISVEDGFNEQDWDGFCKLNKKIGDKMQIVGDDLFVTNMKYLQKGIDLNAANSILIKFNQIGTLSETIDTIQLAQKNNYTAIVSHRSGETEDTTIADLAVAFNTGQIKTGSMSRTDRVAKYNQLLRIEECLGNAAVYKGFGAYYNLKK